ncbi:hypothetical protein [Nocardioides sp. cx-173]|uniref:hypothetical protein n=1 Tax=Nocardioides sp. cx-173 TaxID=2898796 RepID=UPI001E33B721|nr:hypothetical protein [Nocardioides sp. cx-173]MCD4524277.1 hypothetical protein [Nocardioides sp. cx-173]UGB41669.1 hypothetical protein LQ940_20220 [Nocardioides sp. cx-173]
MTEDENPYWDEDDHDLLTFTESGSRLQKAIERTRRALDEADSATVRASLEARLAALHDAHARSTRTASEKPGEAGFLGYQPPDAAD